MRKLWLVFSQAVTVALAVLFVVGTLKPQWLARTPVAHQPDVVAIRTAPLPTGSPSTPVSFCICATKVFRCSGLGL